MLVIVVLLSGLFLGPSNVGGDTKSYHIPNHNVGIKVQRNGSLNIVENISHSFDQGAFTYAYQDIQWITMAALSFLAVFGVMLGFYAWKGRGPKVEQYPADSVTSPPSALLPEEVGFLVRNNVDTHVVLATILGLAKKGFLDLYDSAGTPFRVNESPPMTLTDKGKEAIRNRSDGSDITYPERVILESVEMVEDDPLRRYEAAFRMRKLGERVGDALFRKGFYSVDPRRVRKDFSLLAVAIAAAGLVLFTIAFNQTSLFSFSGVLIGFALGSVPVGIIGHKVRRLTVMGTEERGKWISFLHYLHERVDVLKLSDPKDAVGVFDEYIMYLPLIPGLRLSHWMNDLSRHFQGVPYSPVWYHSYYAVRGGSAGGANVAGLTGNDFGTFAQSIGNSIGFYNSWIGSIGGSGNGGVRAGGGGGGGGGGGAG